MNCNERTSNTRRVKGNWPHNNTLMTCGVEYQGGTSVTTRVLRLSVHTACITLMILRCMRCRAKPYWWPVWNVGTPHCRRVAYKFNEAINVITFNCKSSQWIKKPSRYRSVVILKLKFSEHWVLPMLYLYHQFLPTYGDSICLFSFLIEIKYSNDQNPVHHLYRNKHTTSRRNITKLRTKKAVSGHEYVFYKTSSKKGWTIQF